MVCPARPGRGPRQVVQPAAEPEKAVQLQSRRVPLSTLLLVAAAALLAPRPSSAQLQTILTDHFQIHFTPGTSGTARRVAETAEEVFSTLATAYDYYNDFQPIHVLVLDTSDQLGNGAADYYSNTIYIWATNLDFELRGTHEWIRNVLTHELTHILTLNEARRKWPFQFALIEVSRVDQNPDITFSFPLYHLNAPRGWSEGIAQYGANKFGYDTWDSHRDMLLRMAVLEHDLLTYEELGAIEDRSGKYYGELVYNQGYGLMLYIRERYGDARVDELTHHVGSTSFDPAIRRVLGISAHQLYTDWVKYLSEEYGRQEAAIRSAGLFEGEPLRELNEGIIEYYPSFAPDGSKLAYISSEDREFAIPALRIHDFGTGKDKTLDGYVDTRISWSPDGSQLVYVRSKEGYNDLFLYDVARDDEHRVSARLRAKDPAFSPDGKRIAFVHNEDGTNNLGLINRDGTGLVYLTNNNDGTQYWSPRWSPDGRWILFSVFRGEDRDIALMHADAPTAPKRYGIRDRRQVPDSLKAFPDSLAFAAPDTSGFRVLLGTRADERDPCWLPDGSGFVYASDRTGIFNLYRYDLATGRTQQLTNVVGGAFTPSVAADGRVAYSGYHSNDYSLYQFRLADRGQVVETGPPLERDYRSVFRGPSLSDEYSVTQYRGRQILTYIPILRIGPSYVGNTFGLNQVSGGMQFSNSEMLGGSELTAWGVVGKNLRDDVDLNTDVGVYYERSMMPRTGNNKVFNPTLFAAFRHRQVDNLLKGPSKPDTTIYGPGPISVDVDTATLLIPYAEQHLYQWTTRRDVFKTVVKTAAAGVELPLTRRQMLSFNYAWTDYNEDWDLRQFRSRQQVFIIQDGKDITGSLPEAVRANLSQDTVMVSGDDPRTYYRGLDFYSSHDVTAAWSYRLIKPTANSMVDPQGRALTLIYRYQMPTVVDYLVDQGVDDAGNVRNDTVDDFGFPVDELGVRRARFTPELRHLHVNEYIASYIERLGLPFQNTISLQIVGAYTGTRLKDPDKEQRFWEGRFSWPLRYYLGGRNNLSGYPYFSVWGSKLAYGRLAYTFPVMQRLSRHAFNFTLSKLYAELFAEAGAVGNFDHVQWGDLSRRDFLTDVGGEARLHLFTYYRIPMTAYFQGARALDRGRVPLQPGEAPIDRWRYYFGLEIR